MSDTKGLWERNNNQAEYLNGLTLSRKFLKLNLFKICWVFLPAAASCKTAAHRVISSQHLTCTRNHSWSDSGPNKNFESLPSLTKKSFIFSDVFSPGLSVQNYLEPPVRLREALEQKGLKAESFFTLHHGESRLVAAPESDVFDWSRCSRVAPTRSGFTSVKKNPNCSAPFCRELKILMHSLQLCPRRANVGRATE